MPNAKIQNGTRSRIRIIKPLPTEWRSACGRLNAKHWNRCPDCKEPRPHGA